MKSGEVHSHWLTSAGCKGAGGDPSAMFPYWSFTKTVLSICALKQVETGLLDLDEQIGSHGLSLRQLLGHTSGLPDYGAVNAYQDAVARNEKPWPREKLLEATLSQGMVFSPGEGFLYSNIGYMFVRELLEEQSGKLIGEIIAELICEPLELRSVEFWDTLEQSAALHWPEGSSYNPNWVYHGCLIGSAADACRLLHAVFAGKLLGPDECRNLLATRSLGGAIPNRPWTRSGYGLGLMSGEMGSAGQAIGHSGAGPFCVNAVYHFPDASEPITVACFTDGTDEGVAEFAAMQMP